MTRPETIANRQRRMSERWSGAACILSAAALSVAGCGGAAPRPENPPLRHFGYTETRLDAGTYRLTYKTDWQDTGSNVADHEVRRAEERAHDMALWRAALLAEEHGAGSFDAERRDIEFTTRGAGLSGDGIGRALRYFGHGRHPAAHEHLYYTPPDEDPYDTWIRATVAYRITRRPDDQGACDSQATTDRIRKDYYPDVPPTAGRCEGGGGTSLLPCEETRLPAIDRRRGGGRRRGRARRAGRPATRKSADNHRRDSATGRRRARERLAQLSRVVAGGNAGFEIIANALSGLRIELFDGLPHRSCIFNPPDHARSPRRSRLLPRPF